MDTQGHRRTKGFGTIIERADGRVVTYFNGKYTTYATYAEAKKALDHEVLQGKRAILQPASVTVADYLRTYIDRKLLSVKPQTLDRIESTVSLHRPC